MKIIRLPYLAFFFVFLLFGFWSGKQTTALAAKVFANHPPRNKNLYPLPGKESLKGPTSDQFTTSAGDGERSIQRNILFIAVDDIHSGQPILEGVWLSLFIEGTPHLTFMPIYPGLGNGTGNQSGNLERAIHQTFYITQNKQPAPEFLNNLRVRSLWWDGFIMVDKTALAQLVDSLGGVSPNLNQTKRNVNVVDSLPSVVENPQSALLGQALLIQGLCHKASQPPDRFDAFRWIEQTQGHLVSDIDLKAFLSRWLQLNDPNAIFCEFPSLAGGFFQP